MSHTLPNMLDNTISKIREMVDVNSVIGNPITTPDGVTIIPVSKVSVGFGGGGSDYVKNVGSNEPFGGGVGGDHSRGRSIGFQNSNGAFVLDLQSTADGGLHRLVGVTQHEFIHQHGGVIALGEIFQIVCDT